MSGERPDDTRTDDDFAAAWSSDGVTRSFSPTATGVPADLPFLFSGGQRFGPYLIVRPIGKGGMGQVYEAEETDSGRRVAVKILSRGIGDEEERERFLQEGRLAASLSHPNTVYVFGTTEVQGFPVIAMELAPSGTLKDLVVPGSPLPGAQAVDAMLQVIAGLEAAASIGILHRDIKPSNCFVGADGRVLVGDFGLSIATLARAGQSDAPRTILGTPGFASPEQLRGDTLDVRSDIYSVGATIYYLLTGKAPFEGHNTSSLIERVTSEPPPSLTLPRPDLPRRLALVVAKCLAKTPGERYAGYAVLAAALRPFSSTRSRPAPLVRRAFAGWIDLVIVAMPAIALRRAFDLHALNPGYLGESAIVGLVAIVAMIVYYGAFEAALGATPGKALLGLRVVDATQLSPQWSTAVIRALAFAVPLQIAARGATLAVMMWRPTLSSTGFVSSTAGAFCIAVLFSTARRSNGYTALHDRATATQVVLKRQAVEVRERRDRVAAVTPWNKEGTTRLGPYLVVDAIAAPVAAAVSIEGYDDRLGRRVWIELLPPGSPALGERRRDLARPGRVRWLAGRRQGNECWDAYEAVEGDRIAGAAPQPQPWSRVRHWLADLTGEVAAGLGDGSLPALRNQRVWIDGNDRARLLDWTDPGSGAPALDPEAQAPGLEPAQRLLYAVSVGALLGVPPDAAVDRKPDVPLPLPARRLLLAIREAGFKTAPELAAAVNTVVTQPAVFPKVLRARQVLACLWFPILTTAGSILGVAFSNRRTTIESPAALLATALAFATGTLFVVVPFALLGALLMRGGFTFRFFGAALVNRRGEPAAHFRALWRAMVTWTPACLLPLTFIGGSGGPFGRPRLIVQALGLGLIVAAAVWTILHPSRSIQDRLAGTWVVPR